MRILQLLTSDRFSGAENEVCQIINCFSEEIEMIYCSKEGPIRKKVEENGIEFCGIDKININNINNIISKYNPDIIHAHDYTASVIAARCKFNGLIISHIHHSPEFIKKWNLKSLIYTISSRRFNSIVVVSDSIMKNAIFKNLINKKIKKISNYIDKKEILNKAEFSEKNNEAYNYDLAYVGRMVECKNPFEFIKIIREIKKSIPAIKAIMIGNGELEYECKSYINDMNLQNNIDMVGYKSNPFYFLKNSKAIIIPSKREGFGLVALEGMILGKPIIASNVGGLGDLVNSEVGALCNSTNEFVKSAIQILNNDKLYKILSRNAKVSSNKYTNLAKFKESLSNLYKLS